MLKTMIIFLASVGEGTILKLHLHGRLLARRVTRNLLWGLSRRCEIKLGQFTLLQLERFFCPKLGVDQKKKRKKNLRPRWNRVLRPNSLLVQCQSSHILIASDNGWAIFAFGAKIGLKSNKNRAFCILCMPMGGQTPLPRRPWLRYCFLL